MINNNKGFSLVELMVTIIILSSVIFGIYGLLKTIIFEINYSSIVTKLDSSKSNIFHKVYNKLNDNSEKTIYSYSDILDSNTQTYKSSLNPDPDENDLIKTEDEFRRELREILINDGIYKENGHIYGVLDEKNQHEDNGGIINFNEYTDSEKEKLLDYKICKEDSINDGTLNKCNLFNKEDEINNNFGILILKYNGYIEMYYVNNGLLINKVYYLDQNEDTNQILNTNEVINEKLISDVKITKFKIRGINKDWTFYNGDDVKYKGNLDLRLCNIEYINNNINLDKLFCR